MVLMDNHSASELKAQKLHAVYASNSDEIVAFVDRHDTLWDGDFREYLIKMRDREVLGDRVVYRRCSSASKLGVEGPFYRLQLFEQSKKGNWETSVRTNFNQQQTLIREEYREANLPLLRMFAMGDPKVPIRCALLGFQIDSVDFMGEVTNLWVQHHFRFINGLSFHKENLDPGSILSSTDFSKPSTKSYAGIKDMSRTIFLSSTAHDALHKIKRSGDISDYTVEQLPWALRCEANWETYNTFLIGYGYAHLGNYKTWFDEQKN